MVTVGYVVLLVITVEAAGLGPAPGCSRILLEYLLVSLSMWLGIRVELWL